MTKATERAQRFYSSGRVEDARTLLLKAGYEDRLDPTAQVEYDRLFPNLPEVTERLARYQRLLADPDPKTQVTVAREIARQACGEVTNARGVWMRNPSTTGLLTTHLQVGEPPIQKEMLIALSQIFGWYFRDLRSLPALLPHLKTGKVEIRRWACDAVGSLGEPVMAHLFEAFHDKDGKVRSRAIGQIGLTLHNRPLSARGRKAIRESLLHEFDHTDPELRIGVANVLGYAGDADTVNALRTWLRREGHKHVKSAIREAISRLRATSR